MTETMNDGELVTAPHEALTSTGCPTCHSINPAWFPAGDPTKCVDPFHMPYFVARSMAPSTTVVINQRAQFKPTNHALHIILTLLTGGLWLLVYIPLAISHGIANSHR